MYLWRLVYLFCWHSLYMHRFFFFDTPTTETYTLSLHDALPICRGQDAVRHVERLLVGVLLDHAAKRRLREEVHSVARLVTLDRKSTRLNSSHGYISYAVFCLKKKIFNSYCIINQL